MWVQHEVWVPQEGWKDGVLSCASDLRGWPTMAHQHQQDALRGSAGGNSLEGGRHFAMQASQGGMHALALQQAPVHTCSSTLILAVGSSRLSLTGMGTRSTSLASSIFSSSLRQWGRRGWAREGGEAGEAASGRGMLGQVSQGRVRLDEHGQRGGAQAASRCRAASWRPRALQCAQHPSQHERTG